MSDIKLSYFNARGRAETARLILAHAGTGGGPGQETVELPRVVTRGPLHRPAAHPGAVHRRQDPAPVRPAARGQDRRRGRLPVHRHRQVRTFSCLGLVTVTLRVTGRCLASHFGLAGRTNLEAAQADEIVDAVGDLVEKRVAAMKETDEVLKTEKIRDFMSVAIPDTLVRKSIYG